MLLGIVNSILTLVSQFNDIDIPELIFCTPDKIVEEKGKIALNLHKYQFSKGKLQTIKRGTRKISGIKQLEKYLVVFVLPCDDAFRC